MLVAIDEKHETFVALDRVDGIEQEERGSTVRTDTHEYSSDLPARTVAERFEEKLDEMKQGIGSAMGGIDV